MSHRERETERGEGGAGDSDRKGVRERELRRDLRVCLAEEPPSALARAVGPLLNQPDGFPGLVGSPEVREHTHACACTCTLAHLHTHTIHDAALGITA